jgi:hypothetical protein
LIRDLRHPAISRDVVRNAAHHPATQELAGAALLLLPGRLLPLGLVASWATRRVLRRRREQRTERFGRNDSTTLDPRARLAPPGSRGPA